MTTETRPGAAQTLSLSDKMPFGKYAGLKIGELIERDPNYVAWAIKNIGSFTLNKEAASVFKHKKFW